MGEFSNVLLAFALAHLKLETWNLKLETWNSFIQPSFLQEYD